MIDIVAEINNSLTKMSDRKVKARKVSKTDLINLINTNIKMHEDLAYALNSLNDSEMREMYNSGMADLAIVPDLKKGFLNYLSKLKGKAAGAESRRPFGSLSEANSLYVKALTEVMSKIDTLILEEYIDVYETRVSLVAFLGMLQQSSDVINFTSYIYTSFIKARMHTVRAQPKYRQQFIVEKSTKVADIVNTIVNKHGPYEFLADINRLRNKAQDAVLGNNVFGAAPGASNLMPSILDYLVSALSCLNIVGGAMDAWDDYCVWRAKRMGENKEWLECHTAVLRLDLERMDPTSPEYKKLKNVIENYDKMISEYDKNIKEFENDI